MKRVHSLINLGRAKATLESNADEPQVVTQPIEGQPTVEPAADVLSDEQKSQAAQTKADEQIPADGSVPVEDLPAVSQESGTPDTGDGSQPADNGDLPGDPAKRADLPKAPEGTPAELAPELEQKDVTAPQSDNVADDPNNPGDPAKTGEAKSDLPVTTSTEQSAIEGGAAPKETTSTEDSKGTVDAKPSTEALSPEDIAQVAQLAAVAGSAAAGTPAAPAEPAAAPAEPAPAAQAAAPAPVPAEPAAPSTPPAAAAAADAAAQVAASPDGTTPPGPNAGDAAATPAEAAKVAADLIQNNPDTAPAIAEAIDKVADAAVAAAGGAPSDIAAQAEADADKADAANADAEAEADFADGEDERDEADEDLEDADDLEEDLEASQESLLASRALLVALEGLVETALQNGGLSDDAAQMLQTVTEHVADDEGIEQPDLGLESIAYRDRESATDYALRSLRGARQQIDNELVVSQEGFLDIFRSYTTNTNKWVDATQKEINGARQALRSADGSTKVSIPGSFNNALEAATYTSKVLGELFGPFYTKVRDGSNKLTKLAADMTDGDKDHSDISNALRALRLSPPDQFTEAVGGVLRDYVATKPLVGNTRLKVAMSDQTSNADIEKSKGAVTMDVSAADLLKMLDELDSVLQAIKKYLLGFREAEKVASQNRVITVSPQAAAAGALPFPLSLISADYRRAFYRQFDGNDAQLQVAPGYYAGFKLTRYGVKSARKFAAVVLSACHKVAK